MARLPRTRDDVLRMSWWTALALLVLEVVVSPGLLGGPTTHLGGHDGGEFAVTIHWVAVVPLAWMTVVSVLRSGAHHRSPRLSGPYPRSTRLSPGA
ncbi:MAG: hypothetical protein ABWY50_04430 [Aeromicrobium sp.]